MRRLLLAVILLIAAAPLPPAVTPPASGAPPDLSALVDRLTHAPLVGLEDALTAGCAASVAVDDDATCTPAVPAAGTAGAGGDELDVDLVTQDLVRTPRWHADLAAWQGEETGDGLVRVHGYGDVATHDAAGDAVWTRNGWSFFDDWGLDPVIVPIVRMGAAPLDPDLAVSERPFAVGDLTGDGIDDVAVGHYLVRFDEESGRELVGSSMVTVLDGRDGRTRWHQPLDGYVTQLLVSDGALLVGNETGPVRAGAAAGADGTVTTLTGYAFDVAGDDLAATARWAWTFSAWTRLLALEPMGDAGVALAHSSKPVGAAGAAGTVALLDPADGSQAWSVAAAGYPRVLRHDATRDRLVVQQLEDPEASADGRQRYWLTGLDLATGETALEVERAGAVATAFTVADITGDAAAEWVVGDLTQLPVTPRGQGSGTYPEMRVSAFDGSGGRELWTHGVEMPSEYEQGRGGGLASWPVPFSVVGGGEGDDRQVMVATLSSWGDGLRALDGDDGALVWERWGNVTYPLFLRPTTIGGQDAAVAVSRTKVLRAFRFGADDGAALREQPLLGDTFAAVGQDVNADGVADLLVGGESGAVFALDGADLDEQQPGVLWRTTVGEGVRELQLADLDGDGDDELVAAATSGVAALEPATGAVRWQRDLPGEYVWTVDVGDLDGDGGADVVVPGTELYAYAGDSGAPLWTYRPHDEDVVVHFSSAALTAEGVVVAQYLIDFPSPLAPRHHRFLVGVDADSGEEAWSAPRAAAYAHVPLWHSITAAGPTEDGAGTRVAGTWSSRSSPNGVTGSRGLRTDVHDARTGELLADHPATSLGVVHMGTTWGDELGLVEWNWKTVRHLEPDDTEVLFEGHEATSDMTPAHFGEHGDVLLRAWHRVWVHETEAVSEGRGTPLAAEWGELFSGRLEVDDLDQDGSDEVIALQMDWPGYTVVAAMHGAGVSAYDYLPHGIAVLTAE